jgi:hypothetical protein
MPGLKGPRIDVQFHGYLATEWPIGQVGWNRGLGSSTTMIRGTPGHRHHTSLNGGHKLHSDAGPLPERRRVVGSTEGFGGDLLELASLSHRLPAGSAGCKAHSCRYWTVTLTTFSSLLSPVVGSQTLLVAIWMA